MLALDKVVNHAALDRPGAVQRIQRGEIFDRVRLVAAQNVSHAGGFKLEHAGGQSPMEDLLVRLLVFERDVVQLQIRALLRNQLQRRSEEHTSELQSLR